MFVLRFASSIARLLATARLAAAIVGFTFGAEVVFGFFNFTFCPSAAAGDAPRLSVVSATFLFFDFFDLDFSCLSSIATRISASVSGSGLSRRTSSRLSYFVEHCGHISNCDSFSASSEGGVDPDVPPRAFSPAWDITQPQVAIYMKGCDPFISFKESGQTNGALSADEPLAGAGLGVSLRVLTSYIFMRYFVKELSVTMTYL